MTKFEIMMCIFASIDILVKVAIFGAINDYLKGRNGK